MQIKKKILFSFFGPVWEIDHAQKIFKFFEFFQLKSKTRINFRNSPKKSKKNTKNCHEDKKLKVARALCAPPGGIGLKGVSVVDAFICCAYKLRVHGRLIYMISIQCVCVFLMLSYWYVEHSKCLSVYSGYVSKVELFLCWAFKVRGHSTFKVCELFNCWALMLCVWEN